MKTTPEKPHTGVLNGHGHLFGPVFDTWHRLQSGQEKITRFGRYVERYAKLKKNIRKQSGHEHRASVTFLFNNYMFLLRPYVKLDEHLLLLCINIHDEPEGITLEDKPAPSKTPMDDVFEYGTMSDLYGDLGKDVWAEIEKAFLLQFCLQNPPEFPEEARMVMSQLAKNRRNEALFFDGVQRIDYCFYALECYSHHRTKRLLYDVVKNAYEQLDKIAIELPGFKDVVWTKKRREFFLEKTGL